MRAEAKATCLVPDDVDAFADQWLTTTANRLSGGSRAVRGSIAGPARPRLE